MELLKSLRPVFGRNALDWFDRSYLVDWFVVAAIWTVGQLVAWGPTYQRDFSVDDPLISHPNYEDQISAAANHYSALLIPIVIMAIGGLVRKSLHEVHHAAIVVCMSRGLARLITVCIKHSVGRLRPDFLARCQWDAIQKACSGNPHDISKGRLSFPSGHSSTAFSGWTVLALWWAGRTAAWCFGVPRRPRSLASSRLGNFTLTLIPLGWATFVAISRMQDFRHHKEDIIVGSTIGILCALISYHIYWPSPFSAKYFRSNEANTARYLYIHEHNREGRRRLNGGGFELSEFDDDDDDVEDRA